MTLPDITVVPIVEPVQGWTTVEQPTAVGCSDSPSEKIVRAVDHTLGILVGDMRDPWIIHGAPPPLGDVAAIRVPDWKLFELIRHHCFDRTDGMREIEPGGWKCKCTPAAPEVVKAYTKQIRIINGLRLAWAVYNFVVAIPGTFLLYLVAWIIQHPGRLLLAAVLTGIVLLVVFG